MVLRPDMRMLTRGYMRVASMKSPALAWARTGLRLMVARSVVWADPDHIPAILAAFAPLA